MTTRGTGTFWGDGRLYVGHGGGFKTAQRAVHLKKVNVTVYKGDLSKPGPATQKDRAGGEDR